MPDDNKFEQQGQNVTGPQTNIAGGVQSPVLSGRFERIHSIITTGNNSPVFLGYERLRDAVIQPGEVFRRVHIESFVGRRWLIDQVDSILNDENNSCGYLVLEAHAGLGKTAFLAWLVKERNYIHHFVELAPGQEGIEKGLKNLAAQIILAYKLSADEAIPDAAGRPDFLYRLLSQAADKRGPGERIVVVVDALDEAGTPPNQNVLGLPKVLPEGVFFIVSMRPVQVTLQSDRSITHRWPLKILAESRENLDDLKSFLEVSAAWPKVKQALDKNRYTADDFIDALMKKSGGLWIYLHFVIPEIERGERYPLNLDTLPEGLQEYYAGYWNRWREDDKWYGFYLPILTTLAAAQEPSTLERILDWAGIVATDDEKQKLRRILKEKWRPFLAISGEGKEEMYRFYHATVREFFEGKAKQNSPMATENDLVGELSLATRELHSLIAESYLARWGGLEKGLPDLINKRKEDGCYGLRHLAAHLEASEQDDKLHLLLSLETQQGRNLWFEAKLNEGDTSGYINDIMKARQLAEKGYHLEDIMRYGKLIGLQNRYALIVASINSLSGNIPPELLLALVENGIWSKEEGMAYARHIPNLHTKIPIFIKLSSLIGEPKLMGEALINAREIQDEGDRARTLADMASKLLDVQKREVMDEALATAREIKDEWYRACTLADIAPKLQDSQKRAVQDEALATAREIQNDLQRAQALAYIAAILQDAQKRGVQDEALATAREIQNDLQRAQALAYIAATLQDAQKRGVLDEALTISREIYDDYLRGQALVAIALRLQDAHEALAISLEILDEDLRDQALAAIAPRLQDAHEALAISREIQDEKLRTQILAAIAPRLQDAHEALAIARGIQDEKWRARAFAKIAPRLQDAQKIEILDEALAISREIQDEEEHARAFAKIAPKLQDAHKALAIAREIQGEWLSVRALVEIAAKLQDAQKRVILDEALALAQKIPHFWRRALTLGEIAPKLQDIEEARAIARELPHFSLRDQALAAIAIKLQDTEEALELAREIQDNLQRAQALADIATRLQDAQKREVLDEALAVAREIQDDSQRAKALATIAPKLQDIKEALALAREIQDDYWRAKALATITPQLPDAHVALATAREIQDDLQRAKALTAIAPRLQDAQKIEVTDEALELTRKIQGKWSRAQALVAIAPVLQDAQKIEVMDEALELTLEIQDKWSRAEALEGIVSSLLAHKSLIYSSLWPSTIHSLSIRGRYDLLSDLSSLAPLVARLGGDDALLDTIQAIKDVGRWWP